MPKSLALQHLFILNAVVLITHQIDAAFWREWEMFRIPGGNQTNLLLNLPIIALVLYALREVCRETANASRAQWLIVFLGYLTIAVHATFVSLGNEQFLQPMSIALLVATGVLSSAQIVMLWLRPKSAIGK